MEITHYNQQFFQDFCWMYQELSDFVVDLDFWDDDLQKHNTKDEVQEILEKHKNHENIILLAIVESRAVAFIHAEIAENNDAASQIKKYGIIHDLYVKSEFRKLGIARKLLQESENLLKNLGATHIEISVFAPNFLAKNFYEKYGFEQRLITLGKRI